jgi:hypothetical protein
VNEPLVIPQPRVRALNSSHRNSVLRSPSAMFNTCPARASCRLPCAFPGSAYVQEGIGSFLEAGVLAKIANRCFHNYSDNASGADKNVLRECSTASSAGSVFWLSAERSAWPESAAESLQRDPGCFFGFMARQAPVAWIGREASNVHGNGVPWQGRLSLRLTVGGCG